MRIVFAVGINNKKNSMKKIFFLIIVLSSFEAISQPQTQGDRKPYKCSQLSLSVPKNTYTALVTQKDKRPVCNIEFLQDISFANSTTTQKPYLIKKGTVTTNSAFTITTQPCGRVEITGVPLKMPMELTGHDTKGNPVFGEHDAWFRIIISKQDSANVDLSGESRNFLTVKSVSKNIIPITGGKFNRRQNTPYKNLWSLDVDTNYGTVRINFFEEEAIGK